MLVTNHHYAAYLREALDSVLAQTYEPIQLVVVDDGSTDDSRAILRSYGSRVEAILKENGGQASACNAGFRACRGELVSFLDADDVFLPEKVERVVAAWTELPPAALVYHRLETIDAQSSARGNPWPRQLWQGWIRERIERTGGWYPRPPTSGLTMTREYLERLFPIPTEPQRSRLRPGDELVVELKPDSYLSEPAAFVAPVIGLPQTLGRYRIHGRNKSQTETELSRGCATSAQWRRRPHQCVTEFHRAQAVLCDLGARAREFARVAGGRGVLTAGAGRILISSTAGIARLKSAVANRSTPR